MQVDFANLEIMMKYNGLSEDEELVIFYETDPYFKELVGFDPAKSGLKVFTIGYYPMRPMDFIDSDEIEFEEDEKPTVCCIYATTKKWISESKILYDTELDLEGFMDGE